MAKLQIKNLFLRSYIGFSDHEVGKLQDLLINITIYYPSGKAEQSDQPDDTLNYKTVTKGVVDLVENGHFNLLESLVRKILDHIMENNVVEEAIVEVDKPHALRFAESVSITLSEKRGEIKR